MAIKVTLKNFLAGIQGSSTDDAPRGLYGVADAQDVIVNKDGRIVPIPPVITRDDIHLLDTDKFLSFNWRGKEYHLVYDTLLKRKFLPPGASPTPLLSRINTVHTNLATVTTNPFRTSAEITDTSSATDSTRLATALREVLNIKIKTKEYWNTRYLPQYTFVFPAGRETIPNYTDARPASTGGLRFFTSAPSYVSLYRNGSSDGEATPAQAYTNLINASDTMFVDDRQDTYLWNRFIIYDEDFRVVCCTVVRPTLVEEDSGEERLSGANIFTEVILRNSQVSSLAWAAGRKNAYGISDDVYRVATHDDRVIFYSPSGRIPTLYWGGGNSVWDLRCVYHRHSVIPERYGSYMTEVEIESLSPDIRDGDAPFWGGFTLSYSSVLDALDVTDSSRYTTLLEEANGLDHNVSLEDFKEAVGNLRGDWDNLLSRTPDGFVSYFDSSSNSHRYVENSPWFGRDIRFDVTEVLAPGPAELAVYELSEGVYDSPFIINQRLDPFVVEEDVARAARSFTYRYFYLPPIYAIGGDERINDSGFPSFDPFPQFYGQIIIRLRERNFYFTPEGGSGTDYRGFGWDLVGYNDDNIGDTIREDQTLGANTIVIPNPDVRLGGARPENTRKYGKGGFLNYSGVVLYVAGNALGCAPTSGSRFVSNSLNQFGLTGTEPKSFFWGFAVRASGQGDTNQGEDLLLRTVPINFVGNTRVNQGVSAYVQNSRYGRLFVQGVIGFRPQDHFRASHFAKGRWLLGGTRELPHLLKATGLQNLWDFQGRDFFRTSLRPNADRSIETILNTAGEDIIRWMGEKENNFIIGLNHGIVSFEGLQRGEVANSGEYTQGMPRTSVAPVNVFFNTYLLSSDFKTIYFWRSDRNYETFRVHNVSAPISRNATENGEELYINAIHPGHEGGILVADTHRGAYFAFIRHSNDHLAWTRIGDDIPHNGSFEGGIYRYRAGNQLKEINFNSTEVVTDESRIPYIELHPPGFYVRESDDELIVESNNMSYKNGEVVYTGGEVWILNERGGKVRKLGKTGRFSNADASTDSLRLGLVGKVSIASITVIVG